MLTTRAVVCDDFMLLPPSGVPESREVSARFEKTSAKVLGWPGVRGSNLKVVILDIGPGGRTERGFEVKHPAFLFVTEGNGTLASRPGRELEGGDVGAQHAGDSTEPLRSRDAVVVSGAVNLTMANSGSVPLKALYFENPFISPRRLCASSGGKGVLHFNEEDLSGTKSKPGDAKFTRHFISIPEFEAARITVQPFEATSKLETHLRQHVFFVLGGGKGEFYLGEAWRKVEPGDMVYVNSFTVHGFRSNDCVLELLLLSSLRDREEGQR